MRMPFEWIAFTKNISLASSTQSWQQFIYLFIFFFFFIRECFETFCFEKSKIVFNQNIIPSQAIRAGKDIQDLEKKHQKEIQVVQAMFDAEAAEQNAEINKKLNEDFKEGVRQMHRDLLQEVSVTKFEKRKRIMTGKAVFIIFNFVQ